MAALPPSAALLEGLMRPLALCLFGHAPKRFAGPRLEFGVLRQRDPHRVAEAVEEQRADAHARLDAPVLAAARLSNAEVQGVVPTALVHFTRQQAVGLDHDLRVRRLHAEYEIVESVLAADLAELDRRRDHTLGCVAVLEHNSLRHRAMVHADPQCFALILELQDQRHEGLLDRVAGLSHVCVCELADRVERLAAVGKIPWIHADLIHEVGDHHGHLRSEVDVCHDRGRVTLLQKAALDVLASLGFAHTLHRDTNDVDAFVRTLLDLRNRGLYVVRERRGHGLRRNAMLGTDLYRADGHRPRLPPHAAVDGLAITNGRRHCVSVLHLRSLDAQRRLADEKLARLARLADAPAPPRHGVTDEPAACKRCRDRATPAGSMASGGVGTADTRRLQKRHLDQWPRRGTSGGARGGNRNGERWGGLRSRLRQHFVWTGRSDNATHNTKGEGGA
mmetsp:Transcript_88113/g.247794  ORF Transcript_88113/g.247794 Transcript_88113/m.247794 type:complete len:448 (-) Transcript_88113:37-1380(-)